MNPARDPYDEALRAAAVYEGEAAARSSRQPEYASWLRSAAARALTEAAALSTRPAAPAQLELFA